MESRKIFRRDSLLWAGKVCLRIRLRQKYSAFKVSVHILNGVSVEILRPNILVKKSGGTQQFSYLFSLIIFKMPARGSVWISMLMDEWRYINAYVSQMFPPSYTVGWNKVSLPPVESVGRH